MTTVETRAPRSAIVPYRVRFDESTPAGTIRTSVLLRYAQDAAWIHSEGLGYGRPWYAERGLAWLVRAVDLEVRSEVETGTSVGVRTEVIGFRRILARRRTEVSVGPEVVAVLVTDWVLIDDRGAPTRIPAEFPRVFGIDEQTFAPTRVDGGRGLASREDGVAALDFVVRPHDLDPMAHVNNAVYLDYLEEAVALAPAGREALRQLPRRTRLEYVTAAGPGEAIRSVAWRDRAARWAFRLVRTRDEGELARGDLTV
ncbi:MAG: acyl-[acyl-carrier-protein] thioesterase [Chloroflexota bacterium]